MRKISEVVEEQIRRSEVALESLRTGTLNLSAYAQSIQPQVEEACWKPVQVGSIVVALSRLQKRVEAEGSLKPIIAIDDLSLKKPLCDISFEKSAEVVAACRQLAQNLAHSTNDFFTLTEGVHEVTVICSQSLESQVLRTVGTAPKAVYSNVVGLSIRFNEKYLAIPNTLYAFLGCLATQRINVIEVVSTYTELTILVESQDANKALGSLSAFMK